MAKTITVPYVEFEGTQREYTVRPLRDDERMARYTQWQQHETDDETRPLVDRRCSCLIAASRASHACTGKAVAAIPERSGHTRYVCGRHLAGHKRSVAHSLKVDAEIAQKNAQRAYVNETADTLARRAGFDVFPYRNGSVWVRVEDLERLLMEAGK